MSLKTLIRLAGSLALAGILLVGCSGSKGSTGAAGAAGAPGTPGLSTGSLSGTVVDSASQTPIAGATVAITPAVAANVSTDTYGKFSFSNIPIGPYLVVVSASGYSQLTSGFISVAAGVTATTTLSLTPSFVSQSLITWPRSYYVDAYDVGLYDVGYGQSISINANVTDPDYPASALTYTWTVQSYPQYGIGSYPNETQIAGANSASITFTTDPILTQLAQPPQSERDSILSIGPMEVGLYRLELYVTNPAGAQATSAIMVRSASKTAGIENVPVGVPIYLNFTETSPNVQLTAVPSGSSASLSTVAATPYTVITFTPDKAGVYSITSSGSSFTIVAGTWAGAYGSDGVFGHGLWNGSQCTSCHSSLGSAPDVFTPMGQTSHAGMFTNGINGLRGDGTVGPNGYEPIDAPPFDSASLDQVTNEVCLSCHTVGYDQAQPVSDNGFNNAMKVSGWSFPSTLQLSNWNTMIGQYPTVAALGNIQCDNCHGPSVSDAHGSGADQVAERVGWNAGVCNQCHDSDGPDWVVSPHANLDLSLSEATVQNSPAAAQCGRCHSAQGFAAYVDQVSAYGFTGSTSNLGFGTLSQSQLAGMGLTVSQVQPQTCQACHDPHNATNPAQIRIYDSTILAAGFTVNSVGAGALCMQCHNTRNGLHNDSVLLTNYSAPHTPSQADILMGENSYFTGITGTTTIFVSKHANISDTCVTCHMVDNPNNAGGAPTSHVWTINSADKGAICQNCHGVGTTGDGLQTEVQGLLSQLQTKLSNDVVTAMNVSSSSYTIWIGASQPAMPITAAVFTEVHGQQGYQVWDNASATYTNSLGAFTASTGSSSFPIFPLNSAANPTATTIVKAGWNYALVDSEGSLGIHNPTYVLTILNNTLNQLP